MKLATLRLSQPTAAPSSITVTSTPSNYSPSPNKPLGHYLVANLNEHHQPVTSPSSSGRLLPGSPPSALPDTGSAQGSRPATYAITYEAPSPQGYDRHKAASVRVLEGSKYPPHLVQLFAPTAQTTLVPLTLPLTLPLRFTGGGGSVSAVMSPPLSNSKQITQGQGQNGNQGQHIVSINSNKHNALKVNLIII